VKKMIADIDKEGAGVIDFDEFLGMMATKCALLQTLVFDSPFLTCALSAEWENVTRVRRF
jgi:hypothetical protein